MGKKAEKEKKERKAVRETAMFIGTGMRFQLLFYNAIPLIIVEGLYTLLSSLIIAPLFRTIFKLLVIVSGFGTLTSENLLPFLTRPLSLLSLIALFVCIGIYSLLDISAAIFTFDCSRQHKHVGVIEIVEFSVKNAVRVVQPKNLLILLVVLVLLPIVSIGVSSSFVSSIEFPISILDVIKSNLALNVVAVIAIVVMLILTLRWTFSIHYFTLERVDFMTAIKKSAKLDRRHRLLNLISMLLVQAALALCNTVLIFVGKKLALLIINGIGTSTIVGSFLLAIVFITFGLAIVILGILGVPISILKISAKYYDLKELAGEECIPVTYTQRTVMHVFKKVVRILCCVLLVGAVLVCTASFYAITNKNINILTEVKGDTEITGYRGGDESKPGNTLGSIENAAQLGADGVSVDAQISKDGQVFLSSSANLSTVGTVKDYAWNLDYATIAEGELTGNVGAILYGDSYSGFPLLSAAIDTAHANGVNLIIDTSLLDYRDDGIDLVTDVIMKSGYADTCEIASRHYSDIEKVCSIAPEIKTVYIAGVAFGAFDSFDCADAIALESVAISSESITMLHGSNKMVYAWCTSSESINEEAAAYKIDNIVATNIKSAQDSLDSLGLSDFSYSIFTSLGSDR